MPEGVKPDAVKSLYAGKGAMTGGPQGEKLMYAMGAEFVEVRVHAPRAKSACRASSAPLPPAG